MTDRASRADAQIDQRVDQLIDKAIRSALERPSRVPASTYRLQFHKGFTFRDAAAIVPYLRRLGVTHCYASPYLRAMSGSTHGYDVVDHSRLNEELGSREDYDAWIDAMRDVGMTHIVDTVPNHMGVGSNENALWNDALEDGPRSLYGTTFDIVWRTELRVDLRNRVLIPVLGDLYGSVLERGELKLTLDADAGRVFVAYFDRRFPLSPESTLSILERIEPAVSSMPERAQQAFANLVDAFSTLPPVNDPEDLAARSLRDAAKRACRERLSRFLREEPTLRQAISEQLDELNGQAGDARSMDRLDALLERQNFRLASWRTASHEINYRRFFDVDALAALQMERPEVFDEAHRLLLSLAAEGAIAGLRIDHSDGLTDPAAYFLQLQRAFVRACVLRDEKIQDPDVLRRLDQRIALRLPAGTPADELPLYVVTEKILAPGEPLPHPWAMHGTSGYDALNEINGLFIDAAGEKELDAAYRSFVGADVPDDYHELAYQQKRRVLTTSFASALNLLTRDLQRVSNHDRDGRDLVFDDLRAALVETTACFSVYRSYANPRDGISPRDRTMIEQAIEHAQRRAPGVAACVFDYLRRVLVMDACRSDDLREPAARFIAKFQQLTSPVTAKGLEDTAFYIFHRLTSLNEVGGEPARFGVSSESLHAWFADRAREWPDAMTVLSTHDTKRSEDVRARISVLSEWPDEWARVVAACRTALKPDAVHPNDEYLLYQTLLGAWPADGRIDATFVDRIHAYMQKAMREAKQRTLWTAPNEAVESAMAALIDGALADGASDRAFRDAFEPFQRRVARVGKVNSLAQTLVRLTAPGVPDTYQGTELWDLSLVDPDNRRPVDYARRQTLLDGLNAAPICDDADVEGISKLWVTSRALRLRRERTRLFARGSYEAVNVQGDRRANVFAFLRNSDTDAAITIVPRCVAALVSQDGTISADAWVDTRLVLPEGLGSLTCQLTGNRYDAGARDIPVADVLRRGMPVALLATDRTA